MKNKFTKTPLIVLTMLILPLLVKSGNDLYGQNEQSDSKAVEIVSNVLNKLSPGQWIARYAFTNYRVDKSEQSYSLEVIAKDSKTIHVSFFEPPRDKGRQILNINGEIWSFLPDSRKIVRLADRDSIGNGDFNNADVLRLNWLDLYNVKVVKESPTQYVIDMTSQKNSGAAYFLIRLWVLKSDLQPVQQYFYDNAGHHLKTLKYRDVKEFHGINRPATLIMENVITGQRTVLVVKDFQKSQGLSESRFKPDNLGK
ncbi:MAG: outer membrane lipoprotein-sorting protein [Spirochaetia bacterium]|nr:outer membrane lipoprotein-sorting protein [Spirochaetia bacterium]